MAMTQAKAGGRDVAFAATEADRNPVPVGGVWKRVFDVVFSMVAIASALPIMLLVLVAVYFAAPGPIFFRHKRIGFDGRAFPCLKFRTMVLDGDRVLEEHLANCPEAREEFALHRKLRHDPRVIPVVGTFLRKFSLDELPQFWNVLCGEMSVVGPRPLTQEELREYGAAASSYKAARPGITGLWQVSGRSDLSFGRRMELDCSYVETCSLSTDVRLIARTIGVLVKGSGAY